MEIKTKHAIIFLIAIFLFFGIGEEIPKMAGQNVIFRTDATGGDYTGAQVAVDSNGDGILEAWTQSGMGSTNQVPSCIVRTPESLCVDYYNSKIRVQKTSSCPSGSYCYWTFNSGGSIPITASSVEPYATNNQEVYIDGATDCDCAVDKNCDNQISRTELGTAIVLWVGSIL